MCESGLIADLPVSHVSLDSFRDLVLSGELQARCNGDRILDGLSGTVTGCRQEGVSSVTNLDHTRCRRSPGKLRVTPEKLEVNDCVRRCDLDELLKHRCPLIGTGHFIEALENVVVADIVAPGLSGVLVCLESVSQIRRSGPISHKKLTSWFKIQIMVSGRVKVRAYAPGAR